MNGQIEHSERIMDQSQTLNVDKFLSMIAFIFLAVLLSIIVSTPPASGYEISLYGVYPSYFWFLLIGTISCGIIILVHQGFTRDLSRWWIAGLLIVIFANSVFLTLPEFRGYTFYGQWDTLNHLGHIKDIIITGHIGSDNFYPVEHILGASLIQITGLVRENVPSLFFVIFSALYILNVYLLASVAASRRGQFLLATAFATPLIYSFFHTYIHPHIFSLFMVPLLLYFYHKKVQNSFSKLQNTALLLILTFSIIFFHPLTTLFTIVVLVTFKLAYVLYVKLTNRKAFVLEVVARSSTSVALFMFINFFIWYISFSTVQQSLKSSFDWLIYQIGAPPIQTHLDILVKAELVPFQTIELFLNRYGAIFLLILVSGTAFIIMLHKSLLRKFEVEPLNFAYGVQFIMAFLIGVIMLFGYFTINNPVRIAEFSLLIGTIFSGLAVYDLINPHLPKVPAKKNKVCRLMYIVITGVIIITMATLSVGSVYNSPRVCKFNSQITQMQTVGTRWLWEVRNPDIAIVANFPKLMCRYEKYNFGWESYPDKAKIDPERLPSHFGYNGHKEVAEVFDFYDRYIVIFGPDKVAPMFYPKNIRSKVSQWTEGDFAKLNADPTVGQIYTNGEFEAWRVYGEG